jgi:hypothetical protein
VIACVALFCSSLLVASRFSCCCIQVVLLQFACCAQFGACSGPCQPAVLLLLVPSAVRWCCLGCFFSPSEVGVIRGILLRNLSI